MRTNSRNFDKTSKSKVKRFAFLLCSILIMLCTISLTEPYVLADIEPINFEAFKHLNQENYQAIQTGLLNVRFRQYKCYTDEQIQAKKQNEMDILEQTKEKILNDLPHNITEEQKGQIIAQFDKGFHRRSQYLFEKEWTEDSYRNYVFDLADENYRLEKRAVDPVLAYHGGERSSWSEISHAIIVSMNGTDLRYHPDTSTAPYPHAWVGDYANAVANGLPLNIGVVPPDELEKCNQAEGCQVNISQQDMDGHRVVVYELLNSEHRILKIYADPSCAYRYRQVERFYRGKLLSERVAKDYKKFNGIPFPTFYQKTNYRDDPNNPISLQVTIQVQDAAFNVDLPLGAFEVEVSPNTVFHIEPKKKGGSVKTFLLPEGKKLKVGLKDVLDMAQTVPKGASVIFRKSESGELVAEQK